MTDLDIVAFDLLLEHQLVLLVAVGLDLVLLIVGVFADSHTVLGVMGKDDLDNVESGLDIIANS